MSIKSTNTNRCAQHVHASVCWLQNPGGRGGTEYTGMLAMLLTFCIRTYLPDAILPAAKVKKNGRGAHWPAPFALSIQYTRSLAIVRACTCKYGLGVLRGGNPLRRGKPLGAARPRYRCDKHHWPCCLPSKDRLRLFLREVHAPTEL